MQYPEVSETIEADFANCERFLVAFRLRTFKDRILGGWAPRTWRAVVNNHGDRKSPKWGNSPSKWPKWFVNGGY